MSSEKYRLALWGILPGFLTAMMVIRKKRGKSTDLRCGADEPLGSYQRHTAFDFYLQKEKDCFFFYPN